MTDLSMTVAPKSNQLNSDDLIGRSMTIVVTKVSAATTEQPIAINFENDGGKPYFPCKSMRRIMIQAWGADGSAYAGRAMTLYRDPGVKFGGIQVGGIRISHMSHMERDLTMALTETKASRKPFTVKVLRQAAAPVERPKPPQEEAPDWDANGAQVDQEPPAAPPEAERALASLLADLKRTDAGNLNGMLSHQNTNKKVTAIAPYPHLVVQWASARDTRQRDLQVAA